MKLFHLHIVQIYESSEYHIADRLSKYYFNSQHHCLIIFVHKPNIPKATVTKHSNPVGSNTG